MQERKEKDLELWEKWRRTNSPKDLEDLLRSLQPLIYRETQKWQSSIPAAALESKARLLTVEALKSYDPNRGAAIATHISSRLRKLSRTAYPQQNVARLPENKQLLYSTFNIAKTKLEEETGRDPTHEELADELGWTPKKVWDFERSFGRRELVESEGAFLDFDNSSGSVLTDFFYRDLPPSDKLLFEDITGYGGKAVLKTEALLKKHRITQGQLSYKKRQFADKLKGIQKGF
jgi:DNA-directed RNA polymerase specialized sigma subunit